MTQENVDPTVLAYDIASVYSTIPNVEAVAIAGSHGAGTADSASDIDLYVYLRDDITIEARAGIAKHRGQRTEINNQFWEPGDEWIEAESQIGVDVMFRSQRWIEDQLSRVLDRHFAEVGYSTCLWYNVRSSHILFDRNGWLHGLQLQAMQPYPDALQMAIIEKNHPILRNTISSYYTQIKKALKRKDTVSVNHRVTALLASYFDILFAVNKEPHPGEKRLLEYVERLCPRRPDKLNAQIGALLLAAANMQDDTLKVVMSLLDGLDHLLGAEGLLPVDS